MSDELLCPYCDQKLTIEKFIDDDKKKRYWLKHFCATRCFPAFDTKKEASEFISDITAKLKKEKHNDKG